MKMFDAGHPRRVFVSGSSALTELTPEMMNALDEMMTKRVQFLIGDCYGADELAQRYLKAKGYEDVIVYCSQEKQHARRICYDRVKSLWDKAKGKTGEEFYQVKDAAMTEDCDIALAFWNGTSYGVKCNIERCKKLGKPCKVFLTPLFQKSKETNPTNFV